MSIAALALTGALLAFAPPSSDPWPGDAGVEIGDVGQPGKIPLGYEPSGAVWHPALDALVLVDDDGNVSLLDQDGDVLISWAVAGDLEAVALPDPAGTLVYLGLEQPDTVLAFDLGTGALTGESWDLTPWMTGPANQGLEALTCVGDLVYAGHQGEGSVYVFELEPGGAVTHVETLASPLGLVDLAGLHHDPITGVLFAVHDVSNVLVEMTPSGALLRDLALPGHDQEGVALVPDCETGAARVFVAQDSGQLWRYEAYPLTCAWTSVGSALAGAAGEPLLEGHGSLASGSDNAALLSDGAPSAIAGFFTGFASTPVPFKGGTLVPFPFFGPALLSTNAAGAITVAFSMPPGVPVGTAVWAQWALQDPGAVQGVALSNAIKGVVP
jgi:hypothetical protein